MSELDNTIKRLKENADIKELPYIIVDIIKNNCSQEVINLILQNLNTLDNTNSGEALKWLEHTGEQWVEHGIYDDVVQYKETQAYREIKQALIKEQTIERENAELKEVFKIISEKNVDILAIKESKTLEDYNRNAWEVEHYSKCKGYRLQLTQEEFDLLKKYYCE